MTLVLLGLRGGLVPLAEPYFACACTPSRTWAYTPGRSRLDVFPAGSVVVSGLPVGAIAVLAAAWVAVTPWMLDPRSLEDRQRSSGGWLPLWHRYRPACRLIPDSELPPRRGGRATCRHPQLKAAKIAEL